METAQLIQKVYRVNFIYKGENYFSIITEDLLSDKVNLEVIMKERNRVAIDSDEEIYKNLEKITYEQYTATAKKR
jgi:hypothetical protein